MNKVNIKFKKHASAILPEPSKGNSGMDVRADFTTKPMIGDDCMINPTDYEIWLKPGDRAIVFTGLFPQIPLGYEIQVRPRSGLAIKEGITVLNTPGTVDASYRGEIGVILINNSKTNRVIRSGDRIAQLVVAKVEEVEVELVEEVSETERNEKGFGSSGKQ